MTTTWSPSYAQITTEAFERIGKGTEMLSRQMVASAGRSLNLDLIQWENSGSNLWKVISGTINLTQGVASYTLEADLVVLTEVYYSQVGAGPNGSNIDRIMTPLTREQYAMLPNKLEQGTPNQYWPQMLNPSIVLTLYQAPAIPSPAYVISWNGLQRISDATALASQTPDFHRRGLDALCAGLAKRLAMKFAPERYQLAAAEAKDAWDIFCQRDQEGGSFQILPNVSLYGRLG